jgi:hypothetical protein
MTQKRTKEVREDMKEYRATPLQYSNLRKHGFMSCNSRRHSLEDVIWLPRNRKVVTVCGSSSKYDVVGS